MSSPLDVAANISRKRSKVINATNDVTLKLGQVGSVVTLNKLASLVVTLPKAAPGVEFTFVSKAATTSGVGYSISPQAADKINYTTGVTNKDLINTQATAALGDAVRLVGVSTTEWQVHGIVGTWAKEA